jgi:predicted permease
MRSLFRSLRNRLRLDDEMSEEIRFHVESRARDLMEHQALTAEESYRKARIEFGSIEKYKEEGRRERGLRLHDELRADIRFSVRQFRQNRVFTAAVILILAIGIGGNVAVFSQINDAILKTLPVQAPENLRQFGWASPTPAFRVSGNSVNSPRGYDTSFSYPAYQLLRDRTTKFSDIFCLGFMDTFNVGIQGRAEALTGMYVSGNYFRGLGIGAALGRVITPDDDRARDSAAVAVISHDFWQRVFNGETSVLGQTIVVNAVPVQIVGVAPEGFSSIDSRWKPDMMLPMALQSAFPGARDLRNGGDWNYLVFGRLSRAASEDQAREESEALLQQAVAATSTESNYVPPKIALIPAAYGFSRAADYPRYWILVGIAGFVLLTACANIAGLLLARGTARHREIATRLALGASRRRVARQLLWESLFLSFLGGGIGVGAVFLLPALAPQPDLRVLAFSIAMIVLTGMLFGLMPAMRTARADLFAFLKNANASGAGRSRNVAAKTLVAAQVALSMMLLFGAGLFIQTLTNLESQRFGINPENLLVFNLNPTLNGYEGNRLRNLYQSALERIEALPGIQSASVSRWGVLSFASSGESVCIPGIENGGAATHNVAPRYFETMGIPLRAGRDIQWSDDRNAPPVALVNETFVAAYYPNSNAIGSTIRMDCRNKQGREVKIIGVVADAKYAQIRGNPPRTAYLSYLQGDERFMTFAVRTAIEPTAAVKAIRQTIEAIDPNLPLHQIATQRERIEISVQQERLFATLLTASGAISLILACLGIYGTLAYFVNRRVREIGIRIAMGAERSRVIRSVFKESITPVAAGLVIGLVSSLILSRFVQDQLFGISPRDPMSLVIAVLALAVTAALASFLPARRASRIDPIAALRHD